MSDERRPAVVLLSGGLDSSITLAIARRENFDCFALSFDYGQRHVRELHAASNVAKSIGATSHIVQTIDLRAFGGSALTSDIEVPKDRSTDHMTDGIPVTYVPARNTIFLSFALGYAEVLDACDIFIGVNAIDYSGYPDCRPHFIAAFEHMARLGTRIGDAGRPIRIHTPLIELSKAQIIERGVELGVDLSLTFSCYDPQGEAGTACGHCDACLLRHDGFERAKMIDPAG